jgi:Mg/Co/Ni transporter MgtE
MTSELIVSTPRLVIASWIVIALVGVAIIATVVLASLNGTVLPTDVPIGP